MGNKQFKNTGPNQALYQGNKSENQYGINVYLLAILMPCKVYDLILKLNYCLNQGNKTDVSIKFKSYLL